MVTKDQSSYAGPMSESAPRTHHLTSFVGQACKAELCFATAALAKSIKGEASVMVKSVNNRQAQDVAPVTVESVRNQEA